MCGVSRTVPVSATLGGRGATAVRLQVRPHALCGVCYAVPGADISSPLLLRDAMRTDFDVYSACRLSGSSRIGH